MIDEAALRALALSLPEAEDWSDETVLRFHVGRKGFAWTYSEVVGPRRPRRMHRDVLAMRCPAEEKETILESDPEVFFTDNHYRGFPAVLVRLDKVASETMRGLLTSAWRQVAPKTLVKRFQDKV